MSRKRFLLTFVLTFLMIISFVQAQTLSETLENAVDTVLEIGSLKFLGVNADSHLIGFVRIAIGILIFSLIYMGLSMIPNMSRNIAITIGILLAIVTAVFTPKSVLVLFGTTYSTIFAFIIIGAPIAAGVWLLLGTPTPSRPVAIIKFCAVLFLIYLMNEISHWADVVARDPTMLNQLLSLAGL